MKAIFKSDAPVSWENGKGFFEVSAIYKFTSYGYLNVPSWYIKAKEDHIRKEFVMHLHEAIARQQLKKVDDKPTEIGLF